MNTITATPDESDVSPPPVPFPSDAAPAGSAPFSPALESAVAPCFQRLPGETPRAFDAFRVFFQLGHSRSLQAVADQLGEGLPTVKNWSSKHGWSERLQSFNSGLLQQQAETEVARQRLQAADWAKRLNHFREQEWDAAQKLLAAAQCFLETFGEEDLRKMSLAQVSRALEISSTLGRLALAGTDLPEASDPAVSPAQQQLFDALNRVYGHTGARGLVPTPSPNPQSPGQTVPAFAPPLSADAPLTNQPA